MSKSRFVRVLSLAAVYVALGRLGQMIALQQVTAVWPPSGVAVAAALAWGGAAAPGVFVGSFALNFWWLKAGSGAASAALVAAVMAGGAAGEALLARFLLQRFAGSVRFLERAADVFRFALAAFVAAVLPATCGTLCLGAFHLLGSSSLAFTWLTWWLGDGVGILVVTPALLLVAKGGALLPAGRRVEALGLLAVVGAVGAASFFGPYPLEYVLIPCLAWAAFRFGAFGTVVTTLLASTIAIWGTSLGRGAFQRASLAESLLLLQAFLGVVAMTALALAAVVHERQQRTAELVGAMGEAREARAAAEESNQAKGILLANMGHEIRTPLNHIIGYSELLEEEAVDARADALVPDIKKVGSAARELLSILQHILELAHLGTARIEIVAAPFSLERVVREAEAAARPLAERRGNTLAVRGEGRAGEMVSDAEKVRAVLDNLLDNACKFTEKGSITLDAAREPVDGRDWITLVVSDTGIGMSPDEMRKIFRDFSQVESGPRRRFRGVGIGLALTRRYCQMMGGDVLVASEKGKGATFTVRLPAEWRGVGDEGTPPIDDESSSLTRRRLRKSAS